MEENNNNDRVLDFIKRRFSNTENANWLNGNCYYFALILKDRFNGIIYYDVINGHFLTLIKNKIYDYSGIVYELNDISILNNTHAPLKIKIKNETLINWDDFNIYDSLQKERINKYCIE